MLSLLINKLDKQWCFINLPQQYYIIKSTHNIIIMRSKVYNNSSLESQLMAYTYLLKKIDAYENAWPISDSGKLWILYYKHEIYVQKIIILKILFQ